MPAEPPLPLEPAVPVAPPAPAGPEPPDPPVPTAPVSLEPPEPLELPEVPLEPPVVAGDMLPVELLVTLLPVPLVAPVLVPVAELPVRPEGFESSDGEHDDKINQPYAKALAHRARQDVMWVIVLSSSFIAMRPFESARRAFATRRGQDRSPSTPIRRSWRRCSG